jgi:hypothetical protein
MGLWYRSFTTLAVADYDVDYLYIFQKNGTQQLPLGSFYKLTVDRTCQLFYLDAQQKKRDLLMITLNPCWFRTEGDSNIHGFIDAVWQHNPNLDVRPGLFR